MHFMYTVELKIKLLELLVFIQMKWVTYGKKWNFGKNTRSLQLVLNTDKIISLYLKKQTLWPFLNPFLHNVPFFYPLKTSENLKIC